MTNTPIYFIDAFTSDLFSGNSAAVVILNNWPSDALMQNIAKENNLSETAFVAPHNSELKIRWFTPTIEVDLCGHATLAAAYVMFEHENYEGDEITFHSKSGVLKVYRRDDHLELDFPKDTITPVLEFPELIRFDKSELIKEIYKGRTDYMFVLDSEKHIKDYTPSFNIIKQLECRGIIITAPSKTEVDFVSRFFAPQSGIDEDAVTGSAHTTLTPFWAQRLGKSKLTAHQLSARGGKLSCELNGDRVYIGGNCVTYIKGSLLINT